MGNVIKYVKEHCETKQSNKILEWQVIIKYINTLYVTTLCLQFYKDWYSDWQH